MSSLLRVGSAGPEVVQLQKALNLAGTSRFAGLAEDGRFGPKTRSRVVEFQQANRLAADGIVGPQTRNALQEYFDLLNKLVDKIAAPPGETAARRRVVNLAHQYHQQVGWRSGNVAGPDNWRIAANLCADQTIRARQGGLALSTIFSVAGAAGGASMKCLTISPGAENNYRIGASGRNGWDIPSWCGIFAVYVYRSSGLKIPTWTQLQQKGYQGVFQSVTSAKHLKPGDMGIYDFRAYHTNHHFIVVDVKGDSVTSIEGNLTKAIGGQNVQTVFKRTHFSVSQILKDKYSAFVSPKWPS